MAKEGDDPRAHALFQQHAEETKSQIDRLTARLRDLGESPSTMKSFMAHMFALAPKSAQTGHDESERISQNLIMLTLSSTLKPQCTKLWRAQPRPRGISTATQAREIQAEERQTAEKVWAMIPTASTDALSKLASNGSCVGQTTR